MMDWQNYGSRLFAGGYLRLAEFRGELHRSSGPFTNPVWTRFFSGTLLVLTVLPLAK